MSATRQYNNNNDNNSNNNNNNNNNNNIKERLVWSGQKRNGEVIICKQNQ